MNRQQEKSLKYLLIYDAGMSTISKHFSVTQKEAKEMVKKFYEKFPEFPKNKPPST